LELRTLLGELGRHPRHPDRLADALAPARARHTAARPSVDDDLTALRRDGAVRHLEADEPLAEAALPDVLERPLADEVVLLELDDPGHAGLERVRLGVGVLADDDVRFLEPEHALPLAPERPDAGGAAGLRRPD